MHNVLHHRLFLVAVSILVLLDLRFERDLNLSSLDLFPRVSILVLLDLRFELNKVNFWEMFLRFNPCFVGFEV